MGHEMEARGMETKHWIGEGGWLGSINDTSKVNRMKRRSILYDLPYFKVHKLY
jgi:hypothetical protein